MTRVVGINRAGSIWVTPQDVALMAEHNLWYRVDFRREFDDPARNLAYKLLGDAKVRCLPILIWNDKRPQTEDQWWAWKDYVQQMVSRYPRFNNWQLWNEPNNARVPNSFFENVDAWRAFLRRTARYIKNVKPDVNLVAGGIAVGGHGSKRIREFWEPWFRVSNIIDRVAIHTYCSDASEAAKAVNNTKRVAEQPVWVTELGCKSTVDGEKQQASWYRGVRDKTGNIPLFWYDLQDVPGSFEGFGALRLDGTRKPVWRSIVAT